MAKRWEELGQFIREHRLQQGMTQFDLAKKLGKKKLDKRSSSEVSRWEKGNRRPKQATLLQLAIILGKPVQVLQQKAGYTPEFDWYASFLHKEQPKEDILLSASDSEKEELRRYLTYLRFRVGVLKTGRPRLTEKNEMGNL